jgi:Fe-S-cluster-containing hydrogenase component 2
MKALRPKESNHEGIPDTRIDQRNYVLFAHAPTFPCLKCADSPCINLPKLTSPAEMLLKGSNLPDQSVCPTKSISQTNLGEIEVNAATCIGCGLCVSSCPVNSLVLNSKLQPISEEADLQDVGSDFQDIRNKISALVKPLNLAISPSLIGFSGMSVQKLLNSDLTDRSIQIYIRNIFLKSGYKCRIRIEGDNNDSFELVAETQEYVYPIEIAIGGDTLDSTRRILSGCATLISKGIVTTSKLRPVLIVDELPNSRSDIYRVLEDMQKYLGLDLRIIPLFILQLLSYTKIDLEKYFTSAVEFPANEWYWRSLLVVANVTENDLRSIKLSK